MTTVAVIGGGAAGMGAARTLLQAGMDVVLIEASPRLGGNCLGVDVRGSGGHTWRVDVGVSDFNRTTFTEFSRLVDDLGLPTRQICSDAGFTTPEGRSVAHCREGEWSFGPQVTDARALIEEMESFRTRCTEVLREDRFATWTTERYLDHIGASDAFREVYLYPRAIGCFPMPDGAPQRHRICDLVAFWKAHGVVGDRPADRHCIVGGMHRYVRAFARWFTARGGELLCGTRVLGIVRSRFGVEVRTVDRDDHHRRIKVSHVVMASNAHDVLPLLEDSTSREREVLQRFTWQRARVVVHRDGRVLGGDREAWGAFNYVVPVGDAPRIRPTITFYPNRLASLPPEAPDVFISMNPHVEPRADRVVTSRFFLHPIAGVHHASAAGAIDAMQGQQRTWFAGSYLIRPFVHESALVSGIYAARRLIVAESRSQRAATSAPLVLRNGAAVETPARIAG